MCNGVNDFTISIDLYSLITYRACESKQSSDQGDWRHKEKWRSGCEWQPNHRHHSCCSSREFAICWGANYIKRIEWNDPYTLRLVLVDEHVTIINSVHLEIKIFTVIPISLIRRNFSLLLLPLSILFKKSLDLDHKRDKYVPFENKKNTYQISGLLISVDVGRNDIDIKLGKNTLQETSSIRLNLIRVIGVGLQSQDSPA